MSVNPEWKVNDVESVVTDGGVIAVKWGCTGSSGEASAFHGGEVTLEYDASASDFIALDDLTEEVVIGWVQAHDDVDVDAIEASLTEKVNAQLNPTTQSGLPWVEEVAE